MRSILLISLVLGLGVGCASHPSKSTTEERTPASCKNKKFAYINIQSDLTIPAASSNGAPGTIVLAGSTAPSSQRRIVCEFINDAGTEMMLPKGARLLTTAHFRRWGAFFWDDKRQMQISCSEEGLNPVVQSVNWKGQEVAVIRSAMNGQIDIISAGACSEDIY